MHETKLLAHGDDKDNRLDMHDIVPNGCLHQARLSNLGMACQKSVARVTPSFSHAFSRSPAAPHSGASSEHTAASQDIGLKHLRRQLAEVLCHVGATLTLLPSPIRVALSRSRPLGGRQVSVWLPDAATPRCTCRL